MSFEKIASRAVLRDREILLARQRAGLRSGVAIVLGGSLAMVLMAVGNRTPASTAAEVDTPQIEAAFAQPELDPMTLVTTGQGSAAEPETLAF